MISSFRYISSYLKIAGIISLFALTAGCTVGRCIAWEDVPATRSLCNTTSTHTGCGGPYASTSYTTFERVCIARLTPDADEAIAKVDNRDPQSLTDTPKEPIKN